jgi:LuxR family maltose regulon positive regulatory protein
MSLSVAVAEAAERSRDRAGVPLVPAWMFPRSRLNKLLDDADRLVTVVCAPTGAGKTSGVAAWAAETSSAAGTVWLNVGHAGSEPDLVWRRLRRGLHDAGERRLPPAPVAPAGSSARVDALIELGEALHGGGPWTVVLDGFPTGASSQLGSDLEILLDHAGRSLRLVLLSRAEPALPLHRYSAAGELARLTDRDLVMDDVEIAGVLRLANVATDRSVVAAVAAHTSGWACGVRRAAVDLVDAADLTSAMQETDGAIEDFLTREVLTAMTPSVRRLLLWTSVVERVPAGVVRAVLGADSRRAVDEALAGTGLVQQSPDGLLSCHPLLRSAARAQLELEQPDRGRARRRRAVRWFADHGAADAAVELSAATQDWAGVASILVQAQAVPRVMAGTADLALRRAAERHEVQAEEPLVRAAVALSRADPLTAEAALANALASPRQESPAQLVAMAFLQLGIARLSGRPVPDADLVPRTRGLLAQADPTPSDGIADLSILLDAYAGAAHLMSGQVEHAAATLTRGAGHLSVACHPSAGDCSGQLALLDAYRGNLREAARRASVLLAGAAGEPRAWVAHAHVALAWVHVERGDYSQAAARLGRLESSGAGSREPWLFLAGQVVEARTLIDSGRPDEALRLAGSWPTALEGGAPSEWLVGQATSVSAEALLALGESQQALALVTSGLAAGSPDRAVLTAEARRRIGDLRGAGAALVSAADELRRAPRGTQVRAWLLEARLVHERGELDRSILLLERALRVASAEGLRRPLAGDGPWLQWLLPRDGTCLRQYLPFVQSLRGVPAAEPSGSSLLTVSTESLLEPLTERETQVLRLVAQMCSTDEIAAELYVSPNTVKTHVKGILRKYGVSRRVDAVRRGRELGSC